MFNVFLFFIMILSANFAFGKTLRKIHLSNDKVVYVFPATKNITPQARQEIKEKIDSYIHTVTQRELSPANKISALYTLKNYVHTIYAKHKSSLSDSNLYGSILILSNILTKLPDNQELFLINCEKETDNLRTWTYTLTGQNTPE